MSKIRFVWMVVAAALLTGSCDTVVDRPVEVGTFEAEVSGRIKMDVEGRAHFIVYCCGDQGTINFFFLTGDSQMPARDQGFYDPTGVFIRTRWRGQPATISIPVEKEVQYDRFVMLNGDRYVVTDGRITITESEDGHAIGDFSLVLLDYPAFSQAKILITGRFHATQVAP